MAEQTVTLQPGESKLVSFEATPHEAKTYQVSVNGLTGSFVAVKVPTKILRPIGVGFQTQLKQYPSTGQNWDKVKEEIPDDNATYVYNPLNTLSADKVGDLYTLSHWEFGPAIINWVKFWIRCYFGVPGYTDSFAYGGVVLRTHNTNYYKVLWGREEGVWLNLSYTLEKNPYTNLPWTVAELNDLQAGVYLWGMTISPLRKCTQVYVEVDYTPT